MTTIFKYFMFGKYGCLDTNARGCYKHVFLVSFFIYTDIHGLSEWHNLMDFRGIKLSNAVDTWDEKELARSSTEGLGPRSLNH